MMFCTLVFAAFMLVLIIEQQFGFDRHGHFCWFANSYILKNHLNDVENKHISINTEALPY